jgi:hypothetical protein
VLLRLMARMPGRERILAKVMAPLHRAASAIALPDYGSASETASSGLST